MKKQSTNNFKRIEYFIKFTDGSILDGKLEPCYKPCTYKEDGEIYENLDFYRDKYVDSSLSQWYSNIDNVKDDGYDEPPPCGISKKSIIKYIKEYWFLDDENNVEVEVEDIDLFFVPN